MTLNRHSLLFSYKHIILLYYLFCIRKEALNIKWWNWSYYCFFIFMFFNRCYVKNVHILQEDDDIIPLLFLKNCNFSDFRLIKVLHSTIWHQEKFFILLIHSNIIILFLNKFLEWRLGGKTTKWFYYLN